GAAQSRDRDHREPAVGPAARSAVGGRGCQAAHADRSGDRSLSNLRGRAGLDARRHHAAPQLSVRRADERPRQADAPGGGDAPHRRRSRRRDDGRHAPVRGCGRARRPRPGRFAVAVQLCAARARAVSHAVRNAHQQGVRFSHWRRRILAASDLRIHRASPRARRARSGVSADFAHARHAARAAEHPGARQALRHHRRRIRATNGTAPRDLAAMMLALVVAALLQGGAPATAAPLPDVRPRMVKPVLAFPEPGLDDTAAYQGYETRLYRDAANNTVQIYLDRRSGRVVELLADALDESVGFTVRSGERPAPIGWSGTGAQVSDSAGTRTLTWSLAAQARRVTIGFFLLGTMRVERDFQYAKAQLKPFDAPPFVIAPESALVAHLAKLGGDEQRRQLALLGAWSVVIERRALDGKTRLRLELQGDARTSRASVTGHLVSIQARAGAPLRIA